MKDKAVLKLNPKQLFFRDNLLAWYEEAEKRYLPWKLKSDAYSIWLSEIILQQTRVEQGLPYYERFVEAYPTLLDLAAAPEDEVLKLWQGLGYYSRARNLLVTASFIAQTYDGNFPSTYAEIRALKGIGDYTAAAIASFAFKLPHAVVDGNVYRVLGRYFGIEHPIDEGTGKKYYAKLAEELLDSQQPDIYNQAIMDFGATHCKAQKPLCESCPLATHCQAAILEMQSDFPVKAKKLSKRNRYFYFLFWENEKGEILLRKRTEKEIWQGLYEFPLVECMEPLVDPLLLDQCTEYLSTMGEFGLKLKPKTASKTYKQTLSHQHIYAVFLELLNPFPINFLEKNAYVVVDKKKIKNFAIPKVMYSYLEESHPQLLSV